MTGFEAADATIDGSTTITGTAANATTQARTGTRSMRCNPASFAQGYFAIPAAAGFLHFGLYFATLPPAVRLICRLGLAPTISFQINAAHQLEVNDAGGTTTGATVLVANTWYWIGVRRQTGNFNGVWVQINGVDEVTKNVTGGTSIDTVLGMVSTQSGAVDAYFDDIVIDDATFLAPSKVALLVPTADSAVGTGWTLGSGGTTGLWDAVNNVPPTAVADTGTTAQIRNAASNTNSYDATMTTYAAAGVATGDTVLAAQPVISTAAPVVTSAKLGTVGVASNPTIANIALGAGGTAGAFWSGLAGGTYPAGWKVSFGTLTTSPSVTIGTAPVMRVTQVTASTRIAMVAFMGINVAWTPAPAAAANPPHSTVYPQILAH